jgi:hypothetical protein
MGLRNPARLITGRSWSRLSQAGANRLSPCCSRNSRTCWRAAAISAGPDPPRSTNQSAKHRAAAASASPSCQPVMPKTDASSPAAAMSANRPAALRTCPSASVGHCSEIKVLRASRAIAAHRSGSLVSCARNSRNGWPQCRSAARRRCSASSAPFLNSWRSSKMPRPAPASAGDLEHAHLLTRARPLSALQQPGRHTRLAGAEE